MGIPHLRMQEVQGIQELLCNDLNVLKAKKPSVIVLTSREGSKRASCSNEIAPTGQLRKLSSRPLPPLVQHLSKLLDIANDLDRDLVLLCGRWSGRLGRMSLRQLESAVDTFDSAPAQAPN